MRFFLPIILYILFSPFYISPANAYQMQDSSIQIRSEDLSIFSNDPNITLIPSPTAFLKNRQIKRVLAEKPSSLRLSLENLLIDYGELEATNPIIRSTRITINSTENSRFTVLAWQDHALSGQDGSVIADTSCDNGSCTEVTAAPWQTPLTYGFGYRCENVEGQPCEKNIASDHTRYKQFADASIKEKEQKILRSTNLTNRYTADMIYKVNIPASQPPVGYSNTVSYLLVPGF